MVEAKVDDRDDPFEVEEFRDLGDEDLATFDFIEGNADFGAFGGGIGAPAVLDVVEGDDFTAFSWKIHYLGCLLWNEKLD